MIVIINNERTTLLIVPFNIYKVGINALLIKYKVKQAVINNKFMMPNIFVLQFFF